jgi:hypothetical protein
MGVWQCSANIIGGSGIRGNSEFRSNSWGGVGTAKWRVGIPRILEWHNECSIAGRK